MIVIITHKSLYLYRCTGVAAAAAVVPEVNTNIIIIILYTIYVINTIKPSVVR